MDTLDLLFTWGTAVVGGALAVSAAMVVMQRRVHVEAATTVLERLIGADNLQRARKLCAAGGRSAYMQGVDAVLVAAQAGATDEGESMLRERLRTQFDEASTESLAPMRAAGLRAWGALPVALVGAVATVVDVDSTPLAVYTIYAFPVAIAGWAILTTRREVREQRACFPRVLDALVANRLKQEADAPASPPIAAPSRPADAGPRARGDFALLEEDAAEASPVPASLLDLRRGACPICRDTKIESRPPNADGLVPWVCTSCGYAQLFAAGAAPP